MLLLPVRVRQVVGFDRAEPMATDTPAFPDSVLLVTDAARFAYCSISSPEAAFDDRLRQLLMVLLEILAARELMPVGA